MTGLCFAGGRVRGPDGHFFQTGCPGCGFRLATAIRVGFILLLTWGMSLYAGTWREVRQIGGHTWLFLFLSAVATGLSWLCYFKALQLGDVSRVAPLDKLSVPLAMLLGGARPGRALRSQNRGRGHPDHGRGPPAGAVRPGVSASPFPDDIKEHP